VYVRILRFESALVQVGKDTWLTGDNETVQCETYEPLDEAPYQLKFVAYSPNANYDHTITVRVTVLPESIATPYQALLDLVAIFRRLLGLR